MHKFLYAAVALGLAAAPGLAAPVTDERPKVLAAVAGLLASWREADNAKGERVLHPDFRLTTFQGEGAARKIYVVDRAGLLTASKGLKPGDWDDRLKNVEVRIGTNGLAIVTARYLFSQNGKPTHCGLVAMQLYKDGGEWRIISFADTHNNLDGRPEAKVCPV